MCVLCHGFEIDKIITSNFICNFNLLSKAAFTMRALHLTDSANLFRENMVHMSLSNTI